MLDRPSCPGSLNPRKDSGYPLNKSLGGKECLSGRLSQPGFEPRTIQIVESTSVPEFHPRRPRRPSPSRFTLWKKPYSHCIEDWVGPSTILVWCRKSSAYNGIQSLDPPVCRKLLYPIYWPGQQNINKDILSTSDTQDPTTYKWHMQYILQTTVMNLALLM